MINKFLFRLTITTIALFSIVGLTACGGGNKGASNSGSNSNSTQLTKNTTIDRNSGESTEVSTNSRTSIPSFKLGANGEYDESALAKKVLAAIKGNPEFGSTPGLYVAQLQDNIVLKSCTSNKPMIKKVVALGESIPNVASVDLRYDRDLYCNWSS